ncbi:hypothetical protein LEP1GSC137_2095 [Leptospira borgpetersenii str. Noumea 25]|nr:hypothetical protein LEP1GSC121_0858 [Leptospira borgpetersenii serovar Castellonis str. 200801910]EMO09816.1 hypothetical protein LEP1GSC137_2095 [Leptospira borgpetersenii str. Noumea 25]
MKDKFGYPGIPKASIRAALWFYLPSSISWVTFLLDDSQ